MQRVAEGSMHHKGTCCHTDTDLPHQTLHCGVTSWCLFLGWLRSQHRADGHSRTYRSVQTRPQRQTFHIKLAISPSHSVLTLGQPSPVLALQCQAPGTVCISQVWLDQDNQEPSLSSGGGGQASWPPRPGQGSPSGPCSI